MLMKIFELIIAAILGGLITMAVSWLMVYGKIRVLTTGYKNIESLNDRFTKCHEEHISCPDKIKDECHEAISKLAGVVDGLVKTISLISGTLDSHLKVTATIDVITEKRFVRIEAQLERIEAKLDDLKGWRVVPPSNHHVDEDD